MSAARKTLLQYHESHFRGQQLPPLSHPSLGLTSNDAVHGCENSLLDDNALCHYEDGVKRTLTDEQVAIFRHTEIQELLRERRAEAESAASFEQIPDGNLDEQAALPKSKIQPSMPVGVREKDVCEAKEDQPVCHDNAESMDCQNHISEQHVMHLDYAEEHTGRCLPAGPTDSLKDNTFTRKIIRYDEVGDMAPPLESTAADPNEEEIVRARFVWPELRD
jgi:Protein of unknown function (DUF3807)